MKKIYLLVILILFSNYSNAQRDNDVAATVAGLIVGAAAVKLAVEQYKERLELLATNHILENYSEYEYFELFSLGLKQYEKTFDPSNIKSHVFVLKPFDDNGNRLRADYKVLVMFMSTGWWNEFGVDFSLLDFKLFGKDEWNSIITEYLSIASNSEINNNEIYPIEYIDSYSRKFKEYNPGLEYSFVKKQGDKVIEFGIKNEEITFNFGDIKIRRKDVVISTDREDLRSSNFRNGNPILKFRKKLTGDTYIVKDFSDEFKVIYNENTLGLFLKSTNELVQYKLSTINEISKTLNLDLETTQ